MTTGRRRVAATAVLTVVLVVATGCQDEEPGDVADSTIPSSGSRPSSTSSSTTTSSTTSSVLAPSTSTTVAGVASAGDLGILDGALAGDGTLGLEAALGLFAAGYGPLPGIEPASAPLLDGTPVLRTLLANLGRLTEAQRIAVTAITDLPGTLLNDVPDDARLQAAVGTITLGQELFGQYLGRRLRADVKVTLAALPYANPDGTHNFSSAASHASALPFSAGDGVTYDECRIRVNIDAPVDATLGFDDPAFRSELAGETFHCLQYGLVGLGDDVPLWVMEGAAAFAGEDFIRGSPRSASWWARWITEPQRPLHDRTYDASGFFFLIKDYVDAYQFTDVFLSDSSPASIRRRFDPSDVFDRWGTQYATTPTWGPTYTISGFGAPATPAPSQPLELTVDGPPVNATGLTASTELSGTAYRFTAPGDVLVVTTDPGDRGGIRFGDGTEAELEVATQSYCLVPGGCVCPGATPEQISASSVASAEVFLGVGPSSGGGPALAARSLGQWCNEVLVPAPPADAIDQCLAQRWVTAGYVTAAAPGVRQETTGGAGAVLELRSDRTTSVDMSASSPVVITSQGADGVITTTSLDYAGSGTGTWSADAGVVNVAGVDTTSFTVRVRVETSAGGQLSDIELPASDIRLSQFAGLLGTGRYECSPVSLTITHVTPGIGGDAGFTFSVA